MEPCKNNSPLTHIPRLTINSDSLLSFGKFLELLVYSHSFHVITPPLCEHTGPTVGSKADASPSRPGLNIARHFTYRTHQITFTLAVVEEIYNVEVPRVQFMYGAHVSGEAKPTTGTATVRSQCTVPAEPETSDVKRVLKREMRTWWHTLSERIDNLASIFPLVWFTRRTTDRNLSDSGANIPRRHRTTSAYEISPTSTFVKRPR